MKWNRNIRNVNHSKESVCQSTKNYNKCTYFTVLIQENTYNVQALHTHTHHHTHPLYNPTHLPTQRPCPHPHPHSDTFPVTRTKEDDGIPIGLCGVNYFHNVGNHYNTTKQHDTRHYIETRSEKGKYHEVKFVFRV